MKKFYPEILNNKQNEVFPQLKFLTEKRFYLAGGTALALQIGHRTSVDLDFYTPGHFEAGELYKEIEKIFKKASEKTVEEEDTLFCTVEETDLSFFWYQHPLIKKPKEYRGVVLASLEDIAAMKLIAISRRPAKRDYIDIFFLLRIFSVEEIFSFASKKYPNINLYYSTRALTYFEDIKEEDKRPLKIFEPQFSWEKAKKKIFEEVKKYQLAMIKK